ncbi:MAG: hypothetical protein K0V04_31540 [Deltaproteobacteria bacterium]|nr:hypothetical protein [Deltaproteobacteria bacterium]
MLENSVRVACVAVATLLGGCAADPGGSVTTEGSADSTTGRPSPVDSSGTGEDSSTATAADGSSTSGSGASTSGEPGICVGQSCGTDPNTGVDCGFCARPGAQFLGCIEALWYCGVKVGYWEPYESSGEMFGEIQIGRPIELARPATLRAVGLVAQAGGDPVRMAIYDEDPVDLAPGNRLAALGPQELGAGDNEFQVAPMELTPGRYWVILHTSANILVPRTADDDINYETMQRLGIPFNAADPFPQPMAGDTIVDDLGYNLYMVVEESP